MLDTADMSNEVPIFRHHTPQPELAAAVQESLLSLDALMLRFSLANRSFDTLVQWVAELQKWRSDLWLAQSYLSAAGFDLPDVDMELDAAPTHFLTTWRNYLAKVWPAVDPARAAYFLRVQ